MTDILSDIKDTFNERIRSPFMLSFLFSWIVWNWFLIYNLASFSDEYALTERNQFINDYIQAHKYNNLTLKPLKYSFIFTLTYILCSSVFLFLFSFYKSSIRPWILKLTAKGDTIERHYYYRLEDKYQKIKANYEANKISTDDLEMLLKTKNSEYNELLSKEGDYEAKYLESEKRIRELVKSIEDNNKLEPYIERKLEFFESKFMNKKAWNVFTKIDEARIQNEELLFEEHSQVRDTVSNKLKFEIQDIRFSNDDIMIHFTLVSIKDRNEKFIYYIYEKDQNLFRGVRVQGGYRHDVMITQKSLTSVQLSKLF